MKKNHLYIQRNQANASKIAYRKKVGVLTALSIFAIAFITCLSLSGSADTSSLLTSAGYSIAFTLLPFAPGVRGTKEKNGHDESEEDFKARTDKSEAPEKFIARCLKSLDEKIEEVKGDKTQSDALKALKEKVDAIKIDDTSSEELKLVKAEIIKLGLEVKSMRETAKVGEDRSAPKGSIEETLKKNKEKIDSFIKNKTGMMEIEHVTKATHTSTDITSRGDTYFDMHEGGAIGQIATRKPFLRSLFNNQAANSEYIKYMDQATVTRDAKNVALCATSTHNSKVTWAPATIQIAKVRDFTHVCLDMMNDYMFVAGEVRNLVDTDVKLKIDDQLLNGTGIHPELNSLSTIASTHSATISNVKDWAGAVVNANLIDLIHVMRSQIAQLGQNNAWQANYALINPGDHDALLLIKNSQGDAIRPYNGMFVDNGGNIYISGVLLIPNPNVTVNTLWMGDFTKGTVYARPGIGIEFSYENGTNFETETVTVKAYERLNLLVRGVNTNAFMKCTDIDAAISAITKS